MGNQLHVPSVQARLLALSARTLAKPFGRGALTLGAPNMVAASHPVLVFTLCRKALQCQLHVAKQGT